MHCFHLCNKPLAFYVLKICWQGTLPDALLYKPFLLPFKTNSIPYSDAYQSCLESRVHFRRKYQLLIEKKIFLKVSVKTKKISVLTQKVSMKIQCFLEKKIVHRHEVLTQNLVKLLTSR